MDKQGIIDSARHQGMRALDNTRREVAKARSIASGNGALGNSRHILQVEDICLEGFRHASEACAVRIGEILGPNAPEMAKELDALLEEISTGFIEAGFPHGRMGRYGQQLQDWENKARANLKQDVATERERIIADLRLGLAGGRNIMSRNGSVNIDNRGGSAQIAVNSPGAAQTVHGDLNAGIGFDPQGLASLLAETRSQLEGSALTIEQKDEIEDAIVAAERETKETTPNPGRIQRALKAVASKAAEYGLPLAQKAAEHYMKNQGWIG